MTADNPDGTYDGLGCLFIWAVEQHETPEAWRFFYAIQRLWESQGQVFVVPDVQQPQARH